MTRLRDIPEETLPRFRDGRSPGLQRFLLTAHVTQTVKRFDGYCLDRDTLSSLRHALARVLRDYLRASGKSDAEWHLEVYPLDGRWLLFEETILPDGSTERDERRLIEEPGGLVVLGKNTRGEHRFLDELVNEL